MSLEGDMVKIKQELSRHRGKKRDIVPELGPIPSIELWRGRGRERQDVSGGGCGGSVDVDE